MLKTLIVEDNMTYRHILKENLHLHFPSMVIEEAAEGKEAMGKVVAFLPQLIFMDIHLPGENGLELTKRIRKDHPNSIIVILTSYDLPEYREAAMRYGAASFITKDFLNFEEIEELIKSLEKDD